VIRIRQRARYNLRALFLTNQFLTNQYGHALGGNRVLFSELWNYSGPAYVKALRLLKAKRPGVFQIRRTGAQVDHPGDRMMWDLLSASESSAPWRYRGRENQ
jgi:hypothetical protein